MTIIEPVKEEEEKAPEKTEWELLQEAVEAEKAEVSPTAFDEGE